MTVGEAYIQLLVNLKKIYEPREAANIANLVVEHVTGFANSSRILHKTDIMKPEDEKKLQQISLELATQKPVQYILHEAYFYGMKLYVDEHVLIPRPETEELVKWIISDIKNKKIKTKILDIGTGSGCMSIAVKKHLPAADVYATDISKNALQVAKRNAETYLADIHFIEADILNTNHWKAFPVFDYIISNPPYIRRSETTFMNNNVLNYEPHSALFVPDENALLFYDAISSFGIQHVAKEGKLFFEINEAFADEVAELLSKKKYKKVEIRKDMQGKNRMIKAEAN